MIDVRLAVALLATLWAAGIGLVLLALVRLRHRIDRLDLDARIDRELARLLDDEANR